MHSFSTLPAKDKTAVVVLGALLAVSWAWPTGQCAVPPPLLMPLFAWFAMPMVPTAILALCGLAGFNVAGKLNAGLDHVRAFRARMLQIEKKFVIAGLVGLALVTAYPHAWPVTVLQSTFPD